MTKMNIGRRVIRKTIKTMLFCYAYFIIFALVLPAIFNTSFYSAYYNKNLNSDKIRQRVEIANRRRFISAITYIDTLKIEDLKRFRFNETRVSKRTLDIVIGVVTVNKDDVNKPLHKLGYLTQTTAGLLHAIMYKEYEKFKRIKIFVCDVDEHLHPEARDMSELFDLTERHQDRVSNDGSNVRDKFENEKDNYVFCLTRAAKYRSKYVMLLEDDIILNANSFRTLNHLIRSRTAQSDWLFVKLYYPEKWMGYGVEMERLCELLGVGIIGGLIFAIVKLCFSRCLMRKKHAAFSQRVFLVGFWTCSSAAYVIGRQYVSSWRSVLPYTHRLVESPGCRAHAVLFRVTHLAELLHYLRGISPQNAYKPFDNYMDIFADQRNFKRYLVEPNVGRHIGYVSNFESRNMSEYLH